MKIIRPRRKNKTPDIEISDRARTIMSSKASARYGKTEPFRPGVPALDLFPVKTWNKYLLEAMTCKQRHHMSYGQLTDNSDLRTSIANENHLSPAPLGPL